MLQGLVRLATVQYEPPSSSNASKRRMFLTNYAVNKAANRAMDVRAASASSSVAAEPVASAGGVTPGDEEGSDKSDACSSDDDEDPLTGGAPAPGSQSSRPKTAGSSGTRKRLPQSKRYEPEMPPWATQVNACRARDGCKWTIDTMLSCMAEQVRTCVVNMCWLIWSLHFLGRMVMTRCTVLALH